MWMVVLARIEIYGLWPFLQFKSNSECGQFLLNSIGGAYYFFSYYFRKGERYKPFPDCTIWQKLYPLVTGFIEY